MVYIATDHDAELNAAEKLRSWGFLDATATLVGTDGGIDVYSRHAIAQVKREAARTGRGYIQNLYGARGTDTTKRMYFFSAAGYSKQAIDEANILGIGLFTYDVTGKTTPVNKVSLPTTTTRSWTSTDYISLFHALKRLMSILGIGTPKRHARRRRT